MGNLCMKGTWRLNATQSALEFIQSNLRPWKKGIEYRGLDVELGAF